MAATTLALALATSSNTPATAESQNAESAVKAAFIFQFAKFVRWPRDAFEKDSTTLDICIWGQDTLNGALWRLEGKLVRERRIEIRHLRRKSTVAGCQIVYVSRAEAARLDNALKRVGRRYVLTVGDTPRFADRGGIINMFRTNERVRFEINVDAARLSGLRISSRLLSLARIVSDAD